MNDLNDNAEIIQEATTDLSHAADLVNSVLSKPGDHHPKNGTYYIIHVVKYKPSQVAVDHENWYVYNNDWHHPNGVDLRTYLRDPRVKHHFRDDGRIFGSSRVALAYVYLNVPAVTPAEVQKALDKVGDQWSKADLDGLNAALKNVNGDAAKLFDKFKEIAGPRFFN